MKKLFAFMIAAALIVSCQSDPEFIETPDGLQYRLLVDEPSEILQSGDLMIVKMEQLLNDSLVFESGSMGDVLNPDQNVADPLKVILEKCSAGDSIEIKMSMKTYVEMNEMFYPDGVDSLDVLTWRIKVEDLGPRQEMLDAFQAKLDAAAEGQLEGDIETLKNVAVNNNLEFEETEEGVLYVVLEEGNGEFPQAGQMVYVNYAVRMMDSLLVDTSIEEVARANDMYNENRPGGYTPISFQLGGPGIIPGWNIGIPKFSKGGKGYLMIPSKFAYGPNGRGQIGPNENLLFEIEVVDFKNE